MNTGRVTVLIIQLCLLFSCKSNLQKEDTIAASQPDLTNEKVIELDDYLDTVKYNIKNKAYYEFPDKMTFYTWNRNHHPVFNKDNNLIGFINSKKDIYYGIQMYNDPKRELTIYRVESRAMISELTNGSFGKIVLDRIVNTKTKEDKYLLLPENTDVALDYNSHIDENLKSVVNLYK